MSSPNQPPKRVPVTPEQKAGFNQIVTSIGDVQSNVVHLPRRYGIFGVEGVGKTSLAAGAPGVVFITGRGETGHQTLMSAGRIPPTPHFPEAKTWEAVQAAVRALLKDKHEYKVVAFDTLNILETLLHEFVIRTQFDGDAGRTGFLSYMTGYEVALEPLREFLVGCDLLRIERRMAILFLGHTRIKTFKNPEGPDYDRYTVDVHEKTWSVIHRWLDVVLFLNFETLVTNVQESKGGKKGKGLGGNRRVLHTERSAAYDAKNRLGLAEHIDLGTEPSESWANFAAAMKEARERSLAMQKGAIKETVKEEPAPVESAEPVKSEETESMEVPA